MEFTSSRKRGLGEVASARPRPLHIIKIGSSSLTATGLFEEVREAATGGARVLVVAGGADGIASHYRNIGRVVRWHDLANGDKTRHASTEEMAFIKDAYSTVTLPLLRQALSSQGLRTYAASASDHGLVTARINSPLCAIVEGRRTIVRDHRAGTIVDVRVDIISELLDAFDVVVLSPPVADQCGGAPINVDADVLAAHLSNRLDADHLRLVTGSAGVLAAEQDPESSLTNLVEGEGLKFVSGRMRQKIRAAELALQGTADVAITGPGTSSALSGTRIWRSKAPASQGDLLGKAIEISSVSGDEGELAAYLAQWAEIRGLLATIDKAGNLLVTKGNGDRTLLMMGHLDTVPYRWPVAWTGRRISGRGSVDAKGSLICFLQVLDQITIPVGVKIIVAGAVEEETTSRGAEQIAASIRADAVIIGEPSGSHALTVAYFGLVKVRLTYVIPAGHTAGKNVRTAADALLDTIRDVRFAVSALSGSSLIATLGVDARNGFDVQQAEAILDIRVAPGTTPSAIEAAAKGAAGSAQIEILRSTPAKSTSRASRLVKAFSGAFEEHDILPRFLAKKGSSDMNTLTKVWGDGIPMVAYGPGDASLDHTSQERLDLEEFLEATSILSRAVQEWATPSPA